MDVAEQRSKVRKAAEADAPNNLGVDVRDPRNGEFPVCVYHHGSSSPTRHTAKIGANDKVTFTPAIAEPVIIYDEDEEKSA